jgi:hypothetical protein
MKRMRDETPGLGQTLRLVESAKDQVGRLVWSLTETEKMLRNCGDKRAELVWKAKSLAHSAVSELVAAEDALKGGYSRQKPAACGAGRGASKKKAKS